MEAVVRKQLSKVKLCRKNDEAIDRAFNSLVKRTVKAGDALIEKGQVGSSLYILVDGAVDAIDNSVKVHSFAAPCRFGERTMLRQDEECTVACVASRDSVLYELTVDNYRDALRNILIPLQVGAHTTLYGREKEGVISFKGIRFGTSERFEAPKVAPLPTGHCIRILPGPSSPQVDPQVQNDSLGPGLIQGLPQVKSIPQDLLFLPTEDTEGTLMAADRIPQNDDCLQLNLYVPAKKPQQPLPVMYFIHGGAFIHGAASNALYDGTDLANKDVIVVLVNYRLGPLGFLYGENIPANLGLLDQITGLKWVQENISKFGGDPKNVTIFGESAGGMSCASLCASPLRTKNEYGTLFHKAIPQSGAALNAHSLPQAKRTTELFLKSLGMDSLNVKSLQNARLDAIIDATREVAQSSVFRDDLVGKSMAFEPVVCPNDPVFEGVQPCTAIREGIAKDVKVMIGVTKNEFALFMFGGMGGVKSLMKHGGKSREKILAMYSDRIAKTLNDETRWEPVVETKKRADDILKALGRGKTDPEISKGELTRLVERVNSIWMFELPCLRFAEAQSLHNDCFVYRLDAQAQVPGLGACHAIDLPLLFGTWKHPLIQMLTGSDEKVEAVSKSMQECWTNFAKTGDPNTPTIKRNVKPGKWEPFRMDKPLSLVFGIDDTEGESIETFPAQPLQSIFKGVCISRL